MALGAINVLKGAGFKPGEVTVLSCDGQREAFEAIKEGWMQATVIYATGGAVGLDMAIRVLKGEPVPKRITTETPLITADNVDEFYDADLQYVR
jgi:ABC-type sugar transport system substrate-binding protein